MSFYRDPEKLTFDDAERLAARFLVDYGRLKTRVTTRELLNLYDEPVSSHNQMRMKWAFDEDDRYVEHEESTKNLRIWRFDGGDDGES